MSFRHVYTVPDYYPNFRCKTGDCRHPCCIGWDIAISMEEYFRMLGMECSPELRRRLDTAFHPADMPSENHYAVISPRWDGDCPLRLENGYCGLQCECGEAAIPTICRYYPRSPKSRYAYQCQCANSCEAVVEMLFAKAEPMSFLRNSLSFNISEEIPHETTPIARLFPAVQRASIRIMQDRTYPLAQRLQHLGKLILVMDIPYRVDNADGIRAVLPFSETVGHTNEACETKTLTDRELLSALTYLRNYLCHIEQNNPQQSELAKEARDMLCMSEDQELTAQTAALWRQYAADFAALFPDNDRMLEQLFINHLCYAGFPFDSEKKNLWESYLSFCTAFALVRLLSVCHAAKRADSETDGLTHMEAYVDTVASVFRLVEHTAFLHNTAILSKRFAFDRPEQIALLCQI